MHMFVCVSVFVFLSVSVSVSMSVVVSVWRIIGEQVAEQSGTAGQQIQQNAINWQKEVVSYLYFETNDAFHDSIINLFRRFS